MKNYWLGDNEDLAQKDTLLMLVGRLEVMKEACMKVTAAELLEYIETKVQELETEYNERYPDKARNRLVE
ncbi:MAG: hypothetical protein IKW37_01210 [Bacteroidaceae bacterium]|nr:hypothetical protein [Bacteroidaceae bacterium]